MADKSSKTEGNVKGPFYVDSECIACGVCASEAPGNFKMDEGETYAFVYKQPENEDEKSACASAAESCPVDAIGDDG